jgi:hypothetical protein
LKALDQWKKFVLILLREERNRRAENRMRWRSRRRLQLGCCE